MRLVDGKKRDSPAIEQLDATIGQKSLGRDVQQIDFAVQKSALDIARALPILRRIQERRAHAEFGQGIHLVLHQCDERRHDHADALAHKRRHLVAERLAGARGHQHQRVASGDDVLDDGLLLSAKGLVAEHPLQDFQRARISHDNKNQMKACESCGDCRVPGRQSCDNPCCHRRQNVPIASIGTDICRRSAYPPDARSRSAPICRRNCGVTAHWWLTPIR